MTDLRGLVAKAFKGLPVPPLTSVSGVRNYLACPRRYFWEAVAKVVPKGAPSGWATGRLIHEMLAAYFKAGGAQPPSSPPDPAEAGPLVAAACPRQSPEAAMRVAMDRLRAAGERLNPTGKALEDLETALATARGVLAAFPAWEQAQVPRLRVVATEWPFWKSTSKSGVSGRVDNLAIVDEAGPFEGRWVVDHKTHAAGKWFDIVERTAYDKQARLYCYETGARGIAWTLIGKCALRRGKSESRDAFLDRVAEDYKTNPGKYFKRWYETISDPESVLADIQGAKSLHGCSRGRYKALGVAAFPQNEAACHNGWRCPFIGLCRGADLDTYAIQEERRGDNDSVSAFESVDAET